MKVSRQSQIVRGIGPSGFRVRVNPHRVFRTPSGNFTPRTHVARNVEAEFVKRRLPATYSAQRPRHVGANQAWVQLSRGDANLGTMHRPGQPPKSVTVLASQNGAAGTRALVRYALTRESNPRRWRRNRVSPACRWDHNKQKWVGPVGEDCGSGRQGSIVVSTRVGGRGSLYNPEQGFFARGAEALRRSVRGLASGTKKLEVDRRGVKIVPKTHIR